MTETDRCELRELIGEEATARVYRAFDRETQSAVAVKVLNPHLRTDAVSLERLRRQIQITRRIAHPQIVAIYDVVEQPDRTFLVMELLSGLSLKEHIALHHPLAPVRSAQDHGCTRGARLGDRSRRSCARHRGLRCGVRLVPPRRAPDPLAVEEVRSRAQVAYHRAILQG